MTKRACKDPKCAKRTEKALKKQANEYREEILRVRQLLAAADKAAGGL